MNANRLFFESSNNRSRELNQFASYANRWTPENPTSDIPAATNSSSNRVISSRIIEDGSYLRLKNVTVGYTFPAKLVKKWKIDKARVYVAAQNLWTCTGSICTQQCTHSRSGLLFLSESILYQLRCKPGILNG